MKSLKVISTFVCVLTILALLSFKAEKKVFYSSSAIAAPQGNTNDVSKPVQQLIDEKVLAPIKAMHDPANIKMFSRAYVGSVWKYELISKPTSKQKYYELELREYRGAFIIDQYKMRVYETDKKVMLEDWKSNTYLTSDKWLDFYKNQKGKQ